MNFEHFINLMEKNWPSAHQDLPFIFPRMDKISNYVGLQISELMRKQGLLASDFHLLTALRRSQTHSPFQLKPSELCNYMLFSWGGLAKVMKRLEDKQIIIRVNSREDKRIRLIRLTEKGQALIEEVANKLHAYQKQLLVGFSEQEAIQLEQLLDKLVNNVDAHEAAVNN